MCAGCLNIELLRKGTEAKEADLLKSVSRQQERIHSQGGGGPGFWKRAEKITKDP